MRHPTPLDRTLGDLVTELPGAARTFDRLGLDYCCHGGRSLADACADAGLDPRAVFAELDRGDRGDAAVHAEPWADLDPPALADHLVATHHRYLHDELAPLEALAEKVEGVHGGRHAELATVRRLAHELRADLEPHLAKEERVLFPAIRALYAGRRDFSFGTVANPIRVMSAEHDRAGELLAQLRDATGGYVAPPDACASYAQLYDRLATLEHDTHVHVHKENHRLFPAAIAKEAER